MVYRSTILKHQRTCSSGTILYCFNTFPTYLLGEGLAGKVLACLQMELCVLQEVWLSTEQGSESQGVGRCPTSSLCSGLHTSTPEDAEK